MLLVCDFTVPDADSAEFSAQASRATELLTAQPGCVRAVIGRSADEPEKWAMTVEFTSVVAYRRAMSPFDVREHVIPFLSRGDAAAYEIFATATDGKAEQQVSVVAADAAIAGPRDASGPATPRG
ncbi:antibiotic biosynthesis monooxygenase [Kibdelosporangium philippinense]|uniref:Antibiotic biosynthesis monooxygenase n=1 Tax=Kibdelosporangium philippinense TaxID=211113 RepID=A0ABS8ZVL9_9PSEU|nr:antibiotic biosynthesis monooxygenase [Kibdelosporangium philippinense]MCE7011647.1 antibiotic biosynthesis monooxygenase [Kibdelosporangium philippinense]